MRPIFIIIIFTLVCFKLYAQWKFENSIEINNKFVGADIQDNIYFIDGAYVKKSNLLTKEKFSYGNINYGEISYVDISNPLKVVLFYKDFNYLVFLDNRFNLLREPINLDDLGLSGISTACGSQRGGFWVYDSNDSRLKYFDNYLKKVNESNSLNLKSKDADYIQIAEFSKYLCVIISNAEIFIFDNFAGFIKKLNYTKIVSVYIDDENLFLVENDKFIIYNFKNNKEKMFVLPETNYDKIFITSKSVYIVINNFLKIYSIVEN